MLPYFYGRTINVPPPLLRFYAYENETLIKHPDKNQNYDHPIKYWHPMSPPWPKSAASPHVFVVACLHSVSDKGGSDPFSPSQSNPVRPNPTKSNHGPPPIDTRSDNIRLNPTKSDQLFLLERNLQSIWALRILAVLTRMRLTCAR
jgi:hypothetical protein